MTGEVLRYAAFTDAGSGGNPADVVLDAESLDDSEMLAIAREVGYSETAFVLPLGLVALPARVTLLQGRDMGAPSRLDVDADTVRVTGSATRLTPASG